MSKINNHTTGYCVYSYDSKTETFGEIIKSGLSRNEAKEIYQKSQNTGFAKTEIINEIKNK